MSQVIGKLIIHLQCNLCGIFLQYLGDSFSPTNILSCLYVHRLQFASIGYLDLDLAVLKRLQNIPRGKNGSLQET